MLTGRQVGFRKPASLCIGMAVGTLVGGFLFNILRTDSGLADISITLHDLFAAFMGLTGHT